MAVLKAVHKAGTFTPPDPNIGHQKKCISIGSNSTEWKYCIFPEGICANSPADMLVLVYELLWRVTTVFYAGAQKLSMYEPQQFKTHGTNTHVA